MQRRQGAARRKKEPLACFCGGEEIKIREAASCAGNSDNQGRWWVRVRFYLPLRTTDPEHYQIVLK
jgi:hypothetical protein